MPAGLKASDFGIDVIEDAGYTSWSYVDGQRMPTGTYNKYPKNSIRQRWCKKASSARVCRYMDLPCKGNSYRRVFDYWWTLYWSEVTMIYLTGDTHGRFERIGAFCEKMHTDRDDILIILGDAGVNFHADSRDILRKEYLSRLPVTLLCIHGNHEHRPETLAVYSGQEWHGGQVYIEGRYPNTLFSRDGEVYDLDGKKAIVIGGAYSIDKAWRVEGQNWWANEQPSPEIKTRVEQALDRLNWQIDIVLSHTTPLKYEPVEVFLPGIDQSKVDKSTEEWLDSIEDRLEYGKWYCGHYHTEKKIDRLQIMFNDFTVLESK